MEYASRDAKLLLTDFSPALLYIITATYTNDFVLNRGSTAPERVPSLVDGLYSSVAKPYKTWLCHRTHPWQLGLRISSFEALKQTSWSSQCIHDVKETVGKATRRSGDACLRSRA